MFRKIDHITVFALLLTLVSILVIYFMHSGKSGSLARERKAMEQNATAKELGFRLATASDYLTREVRLFAITLNPEHMRNYWREVNVTKSREAVIKKLKTIEITKEEIGLLNKAKSSSDALVNTEILAQRLIMEVYEVPEAQMEPMVRDFQLTQEDRELTFNQKINKAREILYNDEYAKEKEQIMEPIWKFQQTAEARIGKEIEDARDKTDLYGIMTSIWMALLTFLIFLFVFNVVQRIGTPLKDLEAQLRSNPKKVEVSEKAMASIQNITRDINKILRPNDRT